MWYWFFYVCTAMPGEVDFCVPFIQPRYETLYETKTECEAVLLNQVNARLNKLNYITSNTCLKTKGRK